MLENEDVQILLVRVAFLLEEHVHISEGAEEFVYVYKFNVNLHFEPLIYQAWNVLGIVY